MDYLEAFKNLKTNNKYSRKSPHKAILLLTVIEMYETNELSENMILFDEKLKSTFQKVWERTLKDEPLFHSEVYLPFWYMQSEDFWHIVPNRGKEDILTLLKDSHIKPSEAKLKDCVKYAELDEDLYFLMTLPSGCSSLKRVLLETYSNLSEKQIDKMSESVDNSIDYSASALSDYEKILSQGKNEMKANIVEVDNQLVRQFETLNEDLQIVLNIQYYSFLKKHRNEREIFKDVCPSVYDLFDKIINHPVKQGDLMPSFAFTYDNFLSDLKISLMSEEGATEVIDKIGKAIEMLRGNNKVEEDVDTIKESSEQEQPKEKKERAVMSSKTESYSDITEIEYVYLDSLGNIIEKKSAPFDAILERDFTTENRKGKPWTTDEENQITKYFNQGKDAKTIAAIIGRTEVAIQSRLAKLGLIDYTYGQEDDSSAKTNNDVQEKVDEEDFTIKNSFGRCSILDKYGNKIFSSEGKLKFINGKLYRLNLKRECFTLKSMIFANAIWIKGEKKIVAYPLSLLYRIMSDTTDDYCDGVENIVDDPVFEECRLNFKGVWFNYKGDPVSEATSNDVEADNSKKPSSHYLGIIQSPLYKNRKQAILRALGFFRMPANIRDICRTISRTAWGTTIKEDDVEEILSTMNEVESIEGKYILRKMR